MNGMRLAEILSAPARFRNVHFAGAGGIGMAGLARLLAAKGFRVSGCDAVASPLLQRLAGEGMAVAVGHDPRHVAEADWAVFSPAVPADAPERLAAAGKAFARGDVLAAQCALRETLAVGGTHGKTTTAAMALHVLRAAGIDPDWCIGAEIPSGGFPGGAGAPDGTAFVVEADESDGTLAGYRTRVAVATNVDADHLDHFGTIEALEACFASFLAKSAHPLVCSSCPRAAALGKAVGAETFGFAADDAVRADDVSFSRAGTEYALCADGKRVGRFRLPLAGTHQLLDALGAIAAAKAWGIAPERAAEALADFRLPSRRLEKLAEADGKILLADYAHHPKEIASLMEGVRAMGFRKISVVFQPHRYTRTKALAAGFPPAFAGAEKVWLLPVYAASEPPLAGGTSEDLARTWRETAGAPEVVLAEKAQAAEEAARATGPGDVLLLVGAGDLIALAPAIAGHWRPAP